MSSAGQEQEAKFYLTDFQKLIDSLTAAGAQLLQSRVHEVNLRFDAPDGSLGRAFRALRLRRDTAARLTYKGPGTMQNGVRVRQELECTVGDFDTAQAILEALGYRVVVMYEKYRTTYQLVLSGTPEATLLITLDEMPYGLFAEIEGSDGESIRQAADLLGLNWANCVQVSYIELFERLRLTAGLPFEHLSFANFANLNVTGEMLGVKPA